MVPDTVAGLATMVPTAKGECPYINFDNAASTPPLLSVVETVNRFMPWYASVHRGNGLKSRLSTAAYEEARAVVGRFVGANPDEHVVIFGKNTTEAINKLSYRLHLHRRDVVLIGHLEHHSNDLPWRAKATVKRIATRADGSLNTTHFAQLLARHKGAVRLVAISGASNVTGYMPNLHRLARQAHAAGAQILVDAAQLAAHQPISIKRLVDPAHFDYVVLSAHKMYAPFGTGALIGRRDTFERSGPEYSGGGTVSMVTTKTVDWAKAPDSEEAGSPNVVGAIALARAIRSLQRMDLQTIAAYEAKLVNYALRNLQNVPGITIYGNADPAQTAPRGSVIPFNLMGLPAHLLAAILGYEWGIGVRSGCFCAHPYVLSLLGTGRGGDQRVRYNMLHRRRDLAPGMVRISFGLYNTFAEIDRLIEALVAIAQGNHDLYNVDEATGQYSPARPPDDLAPYFVL